MGKRKPSLAQKSRLLVLCGLTAGAVGLFGVASADAATTATTPDAAHLLISTRAAADYNETEAVTVEALDSGNQIITNFGKTISLGSSVSGDVVSATKTIGSAGNSASYTYGASDKGTHTFYVQYADDEQTITLSASCSACGSPTKYNATVGVNAVSDVSQLVVTGVGTATATSGTGEMFTVAAENKQSGIDTQNTNSVTVSTNDANATFAAATQSGTTHIWSCPGSGTASATSYPFTGLGTSGSGDKGVLRICVYPVKAGTLTATFKDTTTGVSVKSGSKSVPVGPGGATKLVVVAPKSTITGEPTSIKVTAVDAAGNIAKGYVGTVELSDGNSQNDFVNAVNADTGTTNEPSYEFKTSDGGVHTITGYFDNANAADTVTATDTVTASINGSSSAVDVTGGAAAYLTLAPDSTATNWSNLEPNEAAPTNGFDVAAYNKYGGKVDKTSFADTVQLTTSNSADITQVASQSDPNGTGPVTATFGPTAGTVTFGTVTLNTQSQDTVTVVDTSNSAVNGASLTYTPNPDNTVTKLSLVSVNDTAATQNATAQPVSFNQTDGTWGPVNQTDTVGFVLAATNAEGDAVTTGLSGSVVDGGISGGSGSVGTGLVTDTSGLAASLTLNGLQDAGDPVTVAITVDNVTLHVRLAVNAVTTVGTLTGLIAAETGRDPGPVTPAVTGSNSIYTYTASMTGDTLKIPVTGANAKGTDVTVTPDVDSTAALVSDWTGTVVNADGVQTTPGYVTLTAPANNGSAASYTLETSTGHSITIVLAPANLADPAVTALVAQNAAETGGGPGTINVQTNGSTYTYTPLAGSSDTDVIKIPVTGTDAESQNVAVTPDGNSTAALISGWTATGVDAHGVQTTAGYVTISPPASGDSADSYTLETSSGHSITIVVDAAAN